MNFVCFVMETQTLTSIFPVYYFCHKERYSYLEDYILLIFLLSFSTFSTVSVGFNKLFRLDNFTQKSNHWPFLSHCRLQIVLQAIGPTEPHLLVSGQSQLPDRPAPPESVSILSSTKVPQNGNATRR